MIVITTPTGTNGHQVVDRVLRTGARVRVIARDPSRLDPVVRDSVEVVRGSLDDRAVVEKAYAGAESVFFVVPPDPRTDDVKQHYLSFAQVTANAVRAEGVKRLVWISTLGRDRHTEAGLYTAALAADQPLEGSGADYRILRPAVYMDNLLWQVKPILNDGAFALANAADRPHFTVATRDIAEAAASLLTDPAWSGRDEVPLIGDALTPNEMAQVMSRVLDRPIRYHQLTPAAYKARMMATGAGEAYAQALADIIVAENNGFYGSEPDTSARTPTHFLNWCEAVLRPAVMAAALTAAREPAQLGAASR